MGNKAKEDNMIDNKYIIIDKLGEGATANVYLVHPKKEKKKKYAAKVINEKDKYYQNEVSMLKIVSSPYITNLIATGEGQIIRNGTPRGNKQYLIMESASKGDLFSYIYFPEEGLSEKYAKVVFSKILKGVQACHKAGVCHRDLKMENILLDEKYNPKICDFGFAGLLRGKDGSGLLDDILGTQAYLCPEIFKKKPYKGVNADIFSLGCVLFTLVNCSFPFNRATKTDSFYRYIMLKDYNGYLKKVSSQTPMLNEISIEFKNLFFNMVSYDPKGRPSIDEILEKDPWLKELRDLDQKKMKQLEDEVFKIFLEREKIVLEERKKEVEAEETDKKAKNRGIDTSKEYFLDLEPHYGYTGINMKDYIKINGDVKPCDLMNLFANGIQDEYKDKCQISESKKALKFRVIFENSENEKEEIQDDLDEKIAQLELEEESETGELPDGLIKKKCEIQLKLYESYNEGYLLKFSKKAGDIEDYYKNLDKLKKLINGLI